MIPEDPPAPAPAPINYVNVWTIAANPAGLEGAARAWRTYATEAEGTADDVDGPAKAVYDGKWAGPSADEFEQHRRTLTADLRETADIARRQADQLEKAAAALRAGQHALDDALAQLSGKVSAQLSGDRSTVTFHPKDDAQAQLVHDGAAQASKLRKEIDDELLPYETALNKLRPEWEAIANAWASTANGVDPFVMPPEATGPYVLYDGNTAIVNTGTGDDNVKISVDPTTGEQIVEVNGIPYRFPPGADVVVRTGEGNDEVAVAPGTKLKLTLLGGTGDDTINGGEGDETILGHTGADRIHAGAGNDRASGGAGRDYLDGYRGDDTLTGGEGDDVMYGLSGDDKLSGGAGRDYLEGATGRDVVDGGADDDIVSGGRDDDVLRGGGGADKLYAGHGNDTIGAGTGTDTVYAERGDHRSGAEQVVTVEIKDLGQDIRIEGSDEFKERVQADLDMLRSSPRGQEMLAAMDEIHAGSDGGDDNTLTIKETSGGNTAASESWRGGFLWTGEREKYTVEYNPDKLEAQDERPPISGLFHEFAHVYDYGNDTSAPGTYRGADNPGVPNDEREAVGLPVDLDEDGTPDGPYAEHPEGVTENALREEMGWPDRTVY